MKRRLQAISPGCCIGAFSCRALLMGSELRVASGCCAQVMLSTGIAAGAAAKSNGRRRGEEAGCSSGVLQNRRNHVPFLRYFFSFISPVHPGLPPSPSPLYGKHHLRKAPSCLFLKDQIPADTSSSGGLRSFHAIPHGQTWGTFLGQEGHQLQLPWGRPRMVRNCQRSQESPQHLSPLQDQLCLFC